MFDWFKRKPAALATTPPAPPEVASASTLLAGYPVYDAPHVGYGKHLTEAQARANLDYFLRVKPERLASFCAWLLEHGGPDATPALNAPREALLPKALTLTDELQVWAKRVWPGLLDQRLAPRQVWERSHRRDGEIVFSLVFDVAILLGELICRGNPDWRWDVDLDEENLNDDMTSARRVVLLADPVGEMPYPFVIDIEEIVVGIYQHPNDTEWKLLNPWRRVVDEGIRGADMAFWRTTSV